MTPWPSTGSPRSLTGRTSIGHAGETWLSLQNDMTLSQKVSWLDEHCQDYLCVRYSVCVCVCVSQCVCFTVCLKWNVFLCLNLCMHLSASFWKWNWEIGDFLSDSFFLVLLHWWWVGYIKLKQSWVRSLPDECAFRVAMLEEGLRKGQMNNNNQQLSMCGWWLWLNIFIEWRKKRLKCFGSKDTSGTHRSIGSWQRQCVGVCGYRWTSVWCDRLSIFPLSPCPSLYLLLLFLLSTKKIFPSNTKNTWGLNKWIIDIGWSTCWTNGFDVDFECFCHHSVWWWFTGWHTLYILCNMTVYWGSPVCISICISILCLSKTIGIITKIGSPVSVRWLCNNVKDGKKLRDFVIYLCDQHAKVAWYWEQSKHGSMKKSIDK